VASESPAGPTLQLNENEIGQLERVEGALKVGPIGYITGDDGVLTALRQGKTVSREALESLVSLIDSSASQLKAVRLPTGDLLDKLETALQSDEEAKLFQVVKEGAATVPAAESDVPAAESEESKDVLLEGNEEDNRKLSAAIDIIVSDKP
jgi:hypothetical protein